MSEKLQDFDLKSEGDESSPEDGPSRSPRWPVVIAALVVILILVAVFWLRRDAAEPTTEQEAIPVPAVSEPVATDEPESQLELGEIPSLVDSDTWLREVVGQVSSHPQLAKWLVTPELIRGFVVVVDNIAEGTSPAKHLEMAAPEERLGVREADGRVYIEPVSYQRFDLLTDVIASLDTDGTAELYAATLPMMRQAYGDLGYPGEDFDAALQRAIRRVLAVPVVDGPIEVEHQVTAYEFADPALEDLTPAAKQFLRLGPENLQRVQTKLRALARATGLEP